MSIREVAKHPEQWNKIFGIIETRTRLFSRSIVIAYDSNQLPFELWESLMRLKEEPDQAVVVHDFLREIFP